jgi:hypothetical protein
MGRCASVARVPCIGPGVQHQLIPCQMGPCGGVPPLASHARHPRGQDRQLLLILVHLWPELGRPHRPLSGLLLLDLFATVGPHRNEHCTDLCLAYALPPQPLRESLDSPHLWRRRRHLSRHRDRHRLVVASIDRVRVRVRVRVWVRRQCNVHARSEQLGISAHAPDSPFRSDRIERGQRVHHRRSQRRWVGTGICGCTGVRPDLKHLFHPPIITASTVSPRLGLPQQRNDCGSGGSILQWRYRYSNGALADNDLRFRYNFQLSRVGYHHNRRYLSSG